MGECCPSGDGTADGRCAAIGAAPDGGKRAVDQRLFAACRGLFVGSRLACIEPFPRFRSATWLQRLRTTANVSDLTQSTRRATLRSWCETASCRIAVSDVDALFAELQSAGVLHDVSRAGATSTDFGTREFAAVDTDGNLLTFFRWNEG